MARGAKGSAAGGPAPAGADLPRAKRELAVARARGEQSALARVLASYPRHRAELIEFDAGLVATSFADESVVGETASLAERAFARAMVAVFPVAPAPAAVATPALSLKALRQSRRIAMRDLATRLNLGVDVLSQLEAGRIAAASIPARLVRALGEALGTAAEQITATLQAQPALAPALQRSRSGARKDAVTGPLSFDEAVRLSPEMSDEQKAAWLAGD